MASMQILLMQMGLSVLISLLVIQYIRGALAEVMGQACPQNGGRFWLRILNLLLIFAPLLLVILGSKPVDGEGLFYALRNTLIWMLLGHCFALLLLSRIVWKTLVAPALRPEAA